MSVVDRAGSNRLKLQQQGFRLDMSLTIQFPSPSLSLGSFQFTDMDTQPILTEIAVMTVNFLHCRPHMPTQEEYPRGFPLAIPILYPCICENVYLKHDLSANICVCCCISRYWFSSFFLFLFAPADCCLIHVLCLQRAEK